MKFSILGYWFALVFIALFPLEGVTQHTIAREMNEVVLTGIRNDFARPTVHARNLFHTSIAMYDAWAVYDENADTYLLGQTIHEYTSTLDDFTIPTDIKAAQQEALAFAVYRIVQHRYRFSPDWNETEQDLNDLMIDRGYDIANTETTYTDGNPAHMGNYIAQVIIDFGFQDGSNESNFYRNEYYEEVNEPLVMKFPGNPNITDPNRWQPLSVDVFIDQSGNEIPAGAEDFLSPEWGNVLPFSLTDSDKTTHTREGNEYQVYLDPGAPWLIDTLAGEMDTEAYQWGFSMVSAWSSHLSPDDGIMIDISPGAFGNVDPSNYPETLSEYQAFYNFNDGGDIGQGHAVNPHTGQAYAPNVVPRGDYSRVLAEFWADGPDSETPPGHWFTILNYVSDHPQFERKYRGEGALMDTLEWEVKSYLILGGAMHDCAITAWGIKGFYDYLRPVSALRYMCDKGQSSHPNDPNYHVAGIPLINGYIEVINDMSDPLADGGNNIGKIKVKSWKGPDYISDPATDAAGVDWILAEEWWPYQRPSFVTPPFAGYVSGHSTFSRAAAEVLTILTGDPFFPGGMGVFEAKQNEFLVFEEGPSEDVNLQWATYRDASDQTSLSRIWGGIHPPIDDIPGRKMGIVIGNRSVEMAEELFNFSTPTLTIPSKRSPFKLVKNPIESNGQIELKADAKIFIKTIELINLNGQQVKIQEINRKEDFLTMELSGIMPGIYFINVVMDDKQSAVKVVIQ